MRALQVLDGVTPHPQTGQLLIAVSDFTPNLRLTYLSGANFLSVLTSEREIARELFTRGLSRYSDDWGLWYRAAYHELFEMKDEQKAAEYLAVAAQKGAPIWTASLAANLYSKENRYDLARHALEEALKLSQNELGRAEVEKKLQEILNKAP